MQMNPPGKIAPTFLFYNGALVSHHQAAVTADGRNVHPYSNNHDVLITKLRANDVLLGRQKQQLHHIGNIRFQAMLEAMKVS